MGRFSEKISLYSFVIDKLTLMRWSGLYIESAFEDCIWCLTGGRNGWGRRDPGAKTHKNAAANEHPNTKPKQVV